MEAEGCRAESYQPNNQIPLARQFVRSKSWHKV